MSSQAKRSIHRCTCRICQEGEDATTIQYHEQINLLLSRLDEAQRRWYVGNLAQMPEGPSIRQLVAITGLSSATIIRGRHELETGLTTLSADRQRQAGGGRPRAEKKTSCLKQ